MTDRDDTMEFRVLGPFEVSERGRPLEVGAGKQRALLALLLLRGGEVVSTDRLIDALWGEDPPPSALNSVHVYVSHLRKALGNGHLETRGHGYLFMLEPDQLDLDRFERLLGDGRALLAAGEPGQAAETLRAALALWRGPPLSDFASEPFAQVEIARLDELRLAALEERIEADLALGRHAELVPELEALVRESPLRERLRAQLMLALYRTGRQAEALEAYQAARRMLAEELGLEPGRSLQELERAILRHDAQLDPPGRAAAPLGRARRRSGILIAIGAVLLLSAATQSRASSSPAETPPALSSASANSVAAIDAGSNRLVAEVPVGNGPTSRRGRRRLGVGDECARRLRLAHRSPDERRRPAHRRRGRSERDRGRRRRGLGGELVGRHRVADRPGDEPRGPDDLGRRDPDRRRRR